MDVGGSILSGREQFQIVPAPDQRPHRHLPTQLEIIEGAPIDRTAAREFSKDGTARKQKGARKSMRLILGRPIAGLETAMHDQMTAFVREIEALAAQAFLERDRKSTRLNSSH